MKAGRKIYYDSITGVTILDTGQWDNVIRETTVEEDISSYPVLSERNRDSFDVLKLEYDQYQQDFSTCSGFLVDPETKELRFSYPDPNDPNPSEPTYQKPLTEQVKKLQEENTLLKAQNSALSDRADFIEDCIAEMAQQVYQ